jgi:DNA end-binding protein Ku
MRKQAIWKGVVSFANVRVPVKLYAAIESEHLFVHLLHDKDMVPLQRQMVCELDGKPVPPDEYLKAAEVDDDQYVAIEPADLESLAVPSDRQIDVLQFVPTADVDPRYFERPYYLGPDGEPDKYASLAKALRETERAAICQWMFRKRSYAGALLAAGDVLELISLRLADEIVPSRDLHLPRPALSERERKTAKYLVEELSGPFEAAHYRDRFRWALKALAEKKARGQAVEAKPFTLPRATKPNALLDALEASLRTRRKTKLKVG